MSGRTDDLEQPDYNSMVMEIINSKGSLNGVNLAVVQPDCSESVLLFLAFFGGGPDTSLRTDP